MRLHLKHWHGQTQSHQTDSDEMGRVAEPCLGGWPHTHPSSLLDSDEHMAFRMKTEREVKPGFYTHTHTHTVCENIHECVVMQLTVTVFHIS